MSLAMMKKVKESRIKATARFVAFLLADHYNDTTGQCFPSISTLAEETGLSERSIMRALEDLEESKQISIVKTHGRCSKYLLHFPATPDTESPVTESHPCHRVTTTPDRESGDPCQAVTPPLTESHPNHKEPKVNHKENRKLDDFSLSADRPEQPAKSKPSCLEELLDYADEIEMPESEAETFWDSMEAGGWTRNKIKIKDWKAHMRTYNRMGYLKPKGFKPVASSSQYGLLNPQRGKC